jgi:dihydroxyacetone kinase-like protein
MAELLSRCLSRMFHNIADSIEDAKDQLCALDGAIGDADHGVTMSIGFQAVKNELSKRNLDAMPPADLMNLVAMAFLNAIGASTGPLYATGFRRAAQAVAGATSATPEVQAALVKGITDGVRERGKGQRGDKTMLDAWIPATEAAANAVNRSASVDEMWWDILIAAEAGAVLTCSMVAARGRAARLGERALGHLDPGAASAVVILKAMALTFCEDNAKSMRLIGEPFPSGGKLDGGRREAQAAMPSLEAKVDGGASTSLVASVSPAREAAALARGRVERPPSQVRRAGQLAEAEKLPQRGSMRPVHPRPATKPERPTAALAMVAKNRDAIPLAPAANH